MTLWLSVYNMFTFSTCDMRPQIASLSHFKGSQARTLRNQSFIVQSPGSNVDMGTYGMCFPLVKNQKPAHMDCADVADVLACSYSYSLTFQLADLRLTVRPLLVTVHFILMKKSRSVLSSLPFLPKPLPGKHKVTGGKLNGHYSCRTMNRWFSCCQRVISWIWWCMGEYKH